MRKSKVQSLASYVFRIVDVVVALLFIHAGPNTITPSVPRDIIQFREDKNSNSEGINDE
jgi:hypothetical protein